VQLWRLETALLHAGWKPQWLSGGKHAQCKPGLQHMIMRAGSLRGTWTGCLDIGIHSGTTRVFNRTRLGRMPTMYEQVEACTQTTNACMDTMHKPSLLPRLPAAIETTWAARLKDPMRCLSERTQRASRIRMNVAANTCSLRSLPTTRKSQTSHTPHGPHNVVQGSRPSAGRA
jgi:hypothetical protein